MTFAAAVHESVHGTERASSAMQQGLLSVGPRLLTLI
jgi:hypothetical protein